MKTVVLDYINNNKNITLENCRLQRTVNFISTPRRTYKINGSMKSTAGGHAYENIINYQ